MFLEKIPLKLTELHELYPALHPEKIDIIYEAPEKINDFPGGDRLSFLFKVHV